MTVRSNAKPPLQGVALAAASSILFGLSMPLAKLLLSEIQPALLAGLLYLGSGLGLSAFWLARRAVRRTQSLQAALRAGDLPWLGGAVLAGGICAPLALMAGLRLTEASTASLLLNLEGVLTALLAWSFFKEGLDRRLVAGMLLITAGATLLGFSGGSGQGLTPGSLFIVLSCLLWAVDNNLTSKISRADPLQLAAIKGLVSGCVNTAAGLACGGSCPHFAFLAEAMAVGLVGYGLSLVFFILALRHIGAARSAAYFSTSPFVGALCALFILHEPPAPALALAGALMAAGLYLHLSEKHEHEHTHEAVLHEHSHTHDTHHGHDHLPEDPPGQEHNHPHLHEPLTHKHPHYPDIHHHHEH